MIIVGIDAHTRRHSAAAIDEHGRVLELLEVGAGVEELDRLTTWVGGFSDDRFVAVEGAKGFGLALSRRLLDAGEAVVDIATHLTADGRRSSRRRGKDDEIDAITIARVALREPDLPRLTVDQLDTDLKLLVDARDQLVAEATRVRNRLHALLLVLAPGYRDDTGALSNKAGLATARRLVLRGRAAEPVRAKLALTAIGRLHQLEREADDLESEIKTAVDARQPARLLGICGVGPIIAAKILGETRGVERFPTSAAFAAHTGTAPLPPPAGRPTGIVSTGAGTDSSTAPCSPSPWSRPAGTPTPAPTSTGSEPRERAPPKPVAASNAISLRPSTTPCAPTPETPDSGQLLDIAAPQRPLDHPARHRHRGPRGSGPCPSAATSARYPWPRSAGPSSPSRSATRQHRLTHSPTSSTITKAPTYTTPRARSSGRTRRFTTEIAPSAECDASVSIAQMRQCHAPSCVAPCGRRIVRG